MNCFISDLTNLHATNFRYCSYQIIILLSDVLDDICRLFVLADFRNIAIIMFAFIYKVLVEDFNNKFSNYDTMNKESTQWLAVHSLCKRVHAINYNCSRL